MQKFTYNGEEFAFCRPNEVEGNKYYCLIRTSDGVKVEGAQRKIGNQFLLSNGYTDDQLNNPPLNTHTYCRLGIKILEENPNAIKDITGPIVEIDSAKPSIDFYYVMDYIEKNGNKAYKSLDRATSEQERNELIEIKSSAQKACDEVKKMAKTLEEEFGLDDWKTPGWTDGSHQKIRDYLWVKMKYKNYANDRESISIFVNKGCPNVPGREKTRVRFALEMENEGAKPEDYARHHKLLELPLEEGLCYVKGSDELHNAAVVFENQDIVKEKVKNKTYPKIQISKVINCDEGLSNDDIYQEMLNGVTQLINYYEYVIGKNAIIVKNTTSSTELKERKDYSNMNKNISLNTILYGPPGTGKTYNSKTYAVAICNYNGDLDKVKSLDYINEVIPQYNKLVEEGRVSFTTFHQSYGYEEFIEGIKPILKDDDSKDVYYDVVPGVFKKFCDDNRKEVKSLESLGIDSNTQIWKMSVEGGKTNIIKECFSENNLRINFDLDSHDSSMIIFRDKMQPGDLVLSFASVYEINGVAQIQEGDIEVLNSKSKYKYARKVKWLFKDKIVNIKEVNSGVQLHQYTCTGLPHLNRIAFYDLLNKNLDEGTKIIEKKPCVFIIDEINRGNISKIFGELITLIEPSKRDGAKEAMSCILPYKKDEFSVPDNVYILGTMNTADRSIALMDTALRRRFDFVEMMPELKPLENLEVSGIKIDEMLKTLNERIEVLYDREHTLGHAFFMPLWQNNSIKELASIFENKIIPLLQEYFYEDYEKIQLVLGDNDKTDDKYKFIKDVKVESKNIFKGKYNDDDLPEKKYVVNKEAFMQVESYKQIM